MGASIWGPSGAIPSLSAEDITYLSPLSNAQLTDVQQVLDEEVNVTRFMTAAQIISVIARNYSLDVTTAVQNALTAMKPGGKLKCVGGGYKLSAALVVTAGITLQGTSSVSNIFGVHTYQKNPTQFWQSAASTPCFKVVGTATTDTACDLNFFDIAMSANQTPAYNDAPVSGKFGIEFTGTRPYSAYRVSIERCSFFSFDKCISAVGYDTGSGVDWQIDNLKIERCFFVQFNAGLFQNTINADAWNVLNNVFVPAPNGAAIYLERSGYFYARGNYAVPGYATNGTVATTAKMYRVGSYYDNIKLVQEAGSDGLQYFLWVDTSTGYENTYNIIELDGCIVEADSLIERQCKIVSHASRFTHDVLCTGNDIEVHSYADSWTPTTKEFVMSGLRPRKFVDAGSTQTRRQITGVATATATTLFNLPASEGWYQVTAWLTGGGAIYSASALLMCDGTTLHRNTGANGANLSITVSGRNVQVTQTSGVSQTIQYSYIRQG